MIVTLSLALPLEAASVRVARRLLRNVLDVLGVAQDAAYDICLALTEACNNVVDHARAEDGYQVVVEVDDESCRMTVTDTGRGFGPGVLTPPSLAVYPGTAGGEPVDEARAEAANDAAEGGRGIPLIQALTDRFGISSGPGEGVIVFLEKRLRPPTAGTPG